MVSPRTLKTPYRLSGRGGNAGETAHDVDATIRMDLHGSSKLKRFEEAAR
jgi:hypothetical protein